MNEHRHAGRLAREQRRRGGLQRRVGPVPIWILSLVSLGALAIIGIATANSLSNPATLSTAYAVAEPGVGEVAPDFALPNANGGTYSLSAQRGKTVLLYFHEGLMCAPCWQHLIDIQADVQGFTALGIDDVVAISVDPLAAHAQHADQNGVTLPVLADEDNAAAASYDTLAYGMMSGRMSGHTFIVVGPDGAILWRADYGGPPNFSMYVPNETLIAELRGALGS